MNRSTTLAKSAQRIAPLVAVLGAVFVLALAFVAWTPNSATTPARAADTTTSLLYPLDVTDPPEAYTNLDLTDFSLGVDSVTGAFGMAITFRLPGTGFEVGPDDYIRLALDARHDAADGHFENQYRVDFGEGLLPGWFAVLYRVTGPMDTDAELLHVYELAYSTPDSDHVRLSAVIPAANMAVPTYLKGRLTTLWHNGSNAEQYDYIPSETGVFEYQVPAVIPTSSTKSSTTTSSTTSTTLPATTTTTAPSSQFTDVLSGHPYYTQIADLAGRGIVTGFSDNTFRPNDPVSRQQFAKMIVKTLGLTVTGHEVCPFTDVLPQIGNDPLYPAKYVAVCAAGGTTLGKTATLFGPYENITHQQLITMISRAARLSDPPASYMPDFTTAQFSLDEHFLNAKKAAYAGLLAELHGMGPAYDFQAAATRGEVCVVLYNLLHR